MNLNTQQNPILKELREDLERLTGAGKGAEFHPRTSRGTGVVEIRGQKLVDYTSWDFFNIHSEPRVKRALQAEVEQNGVGAGASRLSSGTSPVHLSCEHLLSQFLGQEATVLFSSTNQAVLSLIAGIVSERDCVVVDDSLQTPVIDASFLVHADVLNFRANDPDTLARILEQTKPYRRKYVFLRTVSPMDGEVLNLPVLVEYAAKAGAHVLLDEGYGLGILGLRGAGAAERFNLINRVFCVYGSLSKALGCYGAFVAGSRILVHYLINRSLTFRSENVLPPCLAAAAESAIGVIEVQPSGRERLRSLSRKLRRGLHEQGFSVDVNSDTPIVGIPVSSRSSALEIAQGLFARGHLVEAVTGGMLLTDQSVLRFLVNIAHSPEQIDALLEALGEVHKRVESSARQAK